MTWLRWLNPLLWFRWGSHFAWCWIVTLPWPKLGAAAPAILALACLLVAIVLTYASDPQWRRGLVESQLRQATQVGSKNEMALLSRRLLRETPNDLRFQFQAAVAMIDGEAAEQALASIERLAIEREFGPAALWLLDKKYSPVQWNDWEERKRQTFGSLLRVASEGQPDNKTIASFYADYLLLTGNTEKALGEITKLVSVQPGRALQGALILRESGRAEQAANMAKTGLELLAKKGDEEPDNVEVALARTQFALFLKQYENALALLNKTAKVSEDTRLRSAIAEVFVLWSRDQSNIKNATERFARQLTLLGQAIKVAPNHPLVVGDLMNVVLACADAQDPKVTQLRDVLVQGIAPELTHFIQGTAAMLRNDVDAATLHLELAAKALPSAPAVLNNLAVAIATQETPDLERATYLVDAAIKQSPNQPFFHETKAQIQLKQKDYAGAVLSFEKSLPAEPLRAQVHEGLHQAYLALGQKELAELHKKQSERFRKAATAAAAESGK
jgi:tetratricopeptide (TPR) repeat protein